MAERLLDRFIDTRRANVESQVVRAISRLQREKKEVGEFDISKKVRKSNRPWSTLRFLMGDMPLFASLDRLTEKGWIEPYEETPPPTHGVPRIFYRINTEVPNQ